MMWGRTRRGVHQRGGKVTPQLLDDVDRVWLSSKHPRRAGVMLTAASRLAPSDAALMLMKHMPDGHPRTGVTASLNSIGIAVGTLTPTLSTRVDARALWRSTLPVMLIVDHPRRRRPLAQGIAEQVGFLVYGSDDETKFHKAQVFADTFERALEDVRAEPRRSRENASSR